MPPRRPRDIGTADETTVVRTLRTHGFPHAERRALHGAADHGDITGTPGIVWEVKGGAAARAASDGQITRWMQETERERQNARADIGILVVARKGIGAVNAHRWWAILPGPTFPALSGHGAWSLPSAPVWPVRLHLADACRVLRAAGYGTPLDEGTP